MKVTVEVSEDEILEEVKKVVTDKVASQIMDDYKGSSQRYCYRQVIKECVREAIKKDIDNLSNRAVDAASKSIENRAVKKMMQKMLEEK